MKKFLMLWPNTSTVRHVNYHVTMFGEIADYIETVFKDAFEYIDVDVLNMDQHKLIKHIIQNDLLAVAMFVSNGNFSASIKYAKLFKQIYPNIKILAYGHLVSQLPNKFAEYEFDAIHTSGDPETAIENFFRYANSEIKIEDVCGIEYKINGRFVKASIGTELPIEKWGFARLDKLPIETYNKIKSTNRIVVNISRGCPFGCPYCLVHKTQGSKERRRDINQLKEYLKTIEDKYAHIKIWAANFTLNKQYVYEFCDMLDQDFPDMTFECSTRVNLLEDEELIKRMARSGCKQITIGVETVQQESLDRLHKNYKANNLEDTILRLQRNGIKAKACVMLNLPGQTKDELVETLEYLTSRNVEIRATIYTPYENLNDAMCVDEIETYNRRTFDASSEEITFRQLLKLEYNPGDYKKILNL